MEEMISQNPRFFGWVHTTLLSIYTSLLFVWVEESRPFAWSTQGRYLYFWHPHGVSLGASDFLFFYLELFFIPAGAIFLCLLVLKRSPSARVLLRPIGGAVAIAGFPLVCLYRQGPAFFFLEASLVFAGACLFLWAYQKWPVSTPVSVVLLMLYDSLCAFFRGMAVPANWKVTQEIWGDAWLVYPAVGFCYTLGWAAYFRHSDLRRQDGERQHF